MGGQMQGMRGRVRAHPYYCPATPKHEFSLSVHIGNRCPPMPVLLLIFKQIITPSLSLIICLTLYFMNSLMLIYTPLPEYIHFNIIVLHMKPVKFNLSYINFMKFSKNILVWKQIHLGICGFWKCITVKFSTG